MPTDGNGATSRIAPRRLSAFAALLRERMGDILDDWAGAVLAAGPRVGERTDRASLVGPIPALLERVADRADALATGRPLPSVGPEASAYAASRLAQGYDLAASVAELALLRRSVVRRCLGGEPQPGPAEFELLHEAIDEAVASTVSHFADARQHPPAGSAAPEERERLRLALETAGLGTWDFDPATGTVQLDDRSGALFAVAPGVGLSYPEWLSLVVPEDRKSVDAAVQKALDPAGSGAYEIEHRVAGGTSARERILHAVGRAFFAGGRAVRLIGMVRDVTDLKAAQNAIVRSEWAFRTLTEAMPQLVWTARPDGALDYVNQRLADYLGKSTEDVLGSRWFSVVHPEDQSRVAAIWKHAVETGEPYEVEQRLRGADGVYRWHLTRGLPIRDAQGRARRWLGTSTQISELKAAQEALQRAEGEFRTVIETMPQLVWTAEPNGRIDYVNPRLANYLGDGAKAFLASDWTNVVHPEDLDRFLEIWSRAIATGEPFQVERRLRSADGSYRWFLTRAVTIPDEAGKVRKWLGTSTDIEEIKRAEAELKLRGEFEQQLIGIVSHDLRNPLNVVLLSAQALLRSQGLTDRQTKTVVRLYNAAERAGRLIHDLLDFTQARLGGTIPIDRKPLDFQAAVRDVLEEVRAAHPERTIELRSSGDGTGAWDRDRLAQAVINLVSNAIAYSPPETAVRVEIKGTPGEVSLSVHNDGEPIAPELMAQLFEPMRRGTRSGERGSVGLGLFIVRSIARAHGGTVDVRSTAEEGTTFCMVLPRTAAANASA